ncbi:IS4 family transposase [Streptomyces sp. NPDC001880]
MGGGGLVAVYGTVFDVPCSELHAAHFGRPKTHRTERRAYPQVRMVALAECGTHAITAALVPLSSSEPALARGLFGHLGEGDLLLADLWFTGVERWRAGSAGGADLLWRIRSHQILSARAELPDNSYLSEIVVAKDRKRAYPTPVRVVEYALHGTGFPEQAVPYPLIATNLDPEAAPAAFYHERWEIETTLDELKTHQRGPAQVLRSRSPDGVEHEVWGHLLVHYAIRSLMHDTADVTQLDADRISFIRSLRIARRQVTAQAAFSPDRLATALAEILQEITRHLLPVNRPGFGRDLRLCF